MSYAIRATKIETGQTKFWADGEPIWWVLGLCECAKYQSVSEAHREIRAKLPNISDDIDYCIDIVPVQS